MKSFKVQDSSGQEFEVSEDKIHEAENDGFLPVVTNGQDSHRVSFKDLPLALKDDFNPVLSSDKSEFESVIRGLAQGVSLGFADEITGAAEALWKAAKGDPATFGELYKKSRDESRANFDEAEKANPKSFMAGQVGGAVGTALIPGLGLAKGAGMLASAGKLGALGAAQGLGSSQADLTEGDIAGAARDTAIGGTIGAITGAAGKGIQKMLPSSERIAGSVINAAEDMSNPLASLPKGSYESVPGKLLGFSEKSASRLNQLGSIPETVGQAARKGTEALASGDLGSVLGNFSKASASKADMLSAAAKGAVPKTAEQVAKPILNKIVDTGIGAAILPKAVVVPALGAKATGAALQGVNKGIKGIAINLSVETVQSLAPKLGKFGNVLLDAAQRGSQSLAATHFVLQQTQPEYRKMIQDMDKGE